MNAVKPDRRTAKRAAGMLLCLLALFAAVPQAGAVNPGARYFTHLKTTDSGLSYNCVHAIIQDSRGFIWLGTSDGLNRYDGMRFRTFHKNELGGNSGFIVSLCEDDRGDIWIGTDSGVVLYDAATDRFRALDTPSDRGTVIHNKVTTIKKDRQGVIWMAVNNQGLFSCDPESGALKNYFVEEGRQTLPANITSFCFDVNNECWLSLYFSNLYHADKALTEATPVEFGDRGQLFRNDNIIEIIESPYNTLYVASVDKGVCEIAPRSSKIRTLIPNAENRYVPESLFSGRDGELWAATTKGIYVYNPGSGETIRLKADRQDKFSLSDSHTLSVLVDDSDGIWIGTNAGGVNYSGAFHQNFDKYHIVGDEPLANCLVRGFADDGEGRLWITTEKSGLMTYSLKTKELRKYRNKQLPEALFGIGHDDGKLWLGSFQGLYRLDLKTGAVKVYSRRDESSSLHDKKNIHHLQDIGRRPARGHDARHAALRPRGRQFHAHPRLRGHVHHRHRRRHLRRPVGGHLRQRAHPLRPRGGSDRAQLHLCGEQSALAAEQQGAFGVPRQRRPHLGDDVQRGILPLRRAKRRFRGL